MKAPICKAAASATLLLAMSAAASAQSSASPPVFDGAGFITAATGCEPQDAIAPPVPTTFVFRPAFSIPGAPEALQLNFIGKAAVLVTSTSETGSLAGTSSIETNGISYWATAYSSGSRDGTSKLTFSPKSVTSSTKFLTISGTIKNLTGNFACVVTIQAALTSRP